MENEFELINGVSRVFSDVKEQLVEYEAVLPDYYPEISKVLKCSVNTGVEDVSHSGDKVSVAGKADLKLIYLDEDKHINVFFASVKYTRIFSGLDICDDDTFFVNQTVANIEHHVTAQRKCVIKAFVQVKLTGIRKSEYKALSVITENGVQTKNSEFTAFLPEAIKDFELDFSDTVSLPEANSKINGVLYSTQNLEFNEIKIIKNKVMLNGFCEINVRFITEDGGLLPEASFTLPFSEVAGFAGADENSECKIFADGVCARIAVNENSDSAQIFVSARIKGICGKTQNLCLPEDVYSVCADAEPKFVPVPVINGITDFNCDFPVSSSAEYYDDTLNAVTAFFTEAPVCTLTEFNGTRTLGGTVNVNFLLTGSDGDMSLVSRTCNFEYGSEILQKGTGFFSCNAAITGATLKNGRIEYSLSVSVNGYFAECAVKELMSGVSFTPFDAKSNNSRIILYYAQKGEKIWDIAKENGCSADLIKQYNSVDGEATSEKTMLVLIK